MDEVCRVCGLPTYLSVDRCPYCGEKYRNGREIANLYSNNNKHNSVIVNYKLVNCCTSNELRKLCGLRDI